MKKAILFIVLILTMAAPVYAATFSDVPSSDSDYEAVSDIVARGIAMGYGDGTFGTDRLVTRAEATKFIARTVGLDCSAYANTEPDFTDTASSYGLKEYIACFKAKGFASGYGDGRFGPQNEVLGPEFLKMLYRAAGIEIPNASCSGLDENACDQNLSCNTLYATVSCPEGEFCTQSMEFSGCENLIYADLADLSLVPYVATAIRDEIRPPSNSNYIGNTSLLRRDVARYLYNFINYVEINSVEGTYNVPLPENTNGKTEQLPKPSNVTFESYINAYGEHALRFSFPFLDTPQIGGYSRLISYCGEERHMSYTRDESLRMYNNGMIKMNGDFSNLPICEASDRKYTFAVQSTEGPDHLESPYSDTLKLYYDPSHGFASIYPTGYVVLSDWSSYLEFADSFTHIAESKLTISKVFTNQDPILGTEEQIDSVDEWLEEYGDERYNTFSGTRTATTVDGEPAYAWYDSVARAWYTVVMRPEPSPYNNVIEIKMTGSGPDVEILYNNFVSNFKFISPYQLAEPTEVLISDNGDDKWKVEWKYLEENKPALAGYKFIYEDADGEERVMGLELTWVIDEADNKHYTTALRKDQSPDGKVSVLAQSMDVTANGFTYSTRSSKAVEAEFLD